MSTNPQRTLLTAAALAAALSAPAHAENRVIGKVVMETGEVFAVGPNGEKRDLRRGSIIQEKEILISGEGARAQIRFRDGGLVALKPDTRFTVFRYREEAGQGKKAGAFLRLVEGGLRTVTGAIKGGKEDQEYRLDTPVASIGVRGTAYALRVCEGDCSGGAQEGLYGAVREGEITVDNDRGQARFGAGQYFHAASAADPARRIITPPAGLLEGTTVARDASGAGQSRSGEQGDGGGSGLGAAKGAATGGPATHADPADAVPRMSFQEATDVDAWGSPDMFADANDYKGLVAAGWAGDPADFQGTGVSAADGGAFDTNSLGEVWVDNQGRVVLVRAGSNLGDPSVRYESMQLAESGGDAGLGISWGRWTGDFQIDHGGTDYLDSSGSLFYAKTQNYTTAAEMDALVNAGVSSATYTATNATGPALVDTSAHSGVGRNWNLKSASLTVDFVNQDLTGAEFTFNDGGNYDATLALTGASRASLGQDGNPAVFVADGMEGDIIYTVTGTRQGSASGSIEGGLAGDAAEAAIVQFDLEAEYDHLVDSHVEGIKILRR
ncbi:FecR family protein [Thiohalorhabdus denitrificans]|uniref:FecR family protein n=1 Tax=Thiohalorhabdus denitrificans TaxID=381306 RepID=A0A1G5C947_9GAMM|nr:FecR domain-containing protein [Thiohalorhabdus denitrificans]SCX98973.1 FecR family protein [Thiohalorhabdus denitrificans]